MSSAVPGRAVPEGVQPFATAGPGEPRQCPGPRRAGMDAKAPAVGGGLGSHRTLPDGLLHLLGPCALPRSPRSLCSSPISTFRSRPPPLSWSSFSSLGGGGRSARPPPGRPLPLWSGREPGEAARGHREPPAEHGGRWGQGRARAAVRGSIPGEGRERSRSSEGCPTLSLI